MRGQCSVSCEIFTIHNTSEATKALAEAIREYIKNAHARPGTQFGEISVRQHEYPPELDGWDDQKTRALNTWSLASRLFSSSSPAERDSREWKDKKDLVEALGEIPDSPYVEVRMFSNLYGEKFWESWFERHDCPELRQNATYQILSTSVDGEVFAAAYGKNGFHILSLPAVLEQFRQAASDLGLCIHLNAEFIPDNSPLQALLRMRVVDGEIRSELYCP